MSLFGRLTKGKQAESKYFDQRVGDEANEAEKKEEGFPKYIPLCNKKIGKDLFVELFRLMKSHDIKATIGIFANSVDNIEKRTGIMINKGIVSQKIAAYLQQTRLRHIEEALQTVKANPPNSNRFYLIDDRQATNMNMPADVLLYPIFSRSNNSLGMILVFRKTLGKKSKLINKIEKIIK